MEEKRRFADVLCISLMAIAFLDIVLSLAAIFFLHWLSFIAFGVGLVLFFLLRFVKDSRYVAYLQYLAIAALIFGVLSVFFFLLDMIQTSLPGDSASASTSEEMISIL